MNGQVPGEVPWDEPGADVLGDIQRLVRQQVALTGNPVLDAAARQHAAFWGVDLDEDGEQ